MYGGKTIAVTGSSGRLGHHAVEILEERGHRVIPISRADGVNVVTGEGLEDALEGVGVIIDAATCETPDGAAEFFETAVPNIQQAAVKQGVDEIIAVSVIGADHFRNGYNAAKATQERAHLGGQVPTRVLRAAQFHEFVEQLLDWTTQDGVAYIPRMRTQLVAARTVALALADMIENTDAAPLGNPVAQIAGPRPENLVDVAKSFSERRGDELRIEAGDWPDDGDGLYAAGALLPAPIAKLTGPTFEEWLDNEQKAKADPEPGAGVQPGFSVPGIPFRIYEQSESPEGRQKRNSAL